MILDLDEALAAARVFSFDLILLFWDMYSPFSLQHTTLASNSFRQEVRGVSRPGNCFFYCYSAGVSVLRQHNILQHSTFHFHFQNTAQMENQNVFFLCPPFHLGHLQDPKYKNELVYQSIFYELLESYPKHVLLYTDGSKENEGEA